MPEDVEPLWFDLLEGRAGAGRTAERARALIDTVAATHVADWGLSSLYALTSGGVRDMGEVVSAFEQWRRHVRDHAADPVGWERRYYQRMVRDFAERHGAERAAAFSARLVAAGLLRED